ncbi:MULTISPECIES: hypothetical protein [unclassified Micromonospora]|uniref:hypothetical protein n=1 Tax=unclassified Micromonospora TaxID=2617518 RepID=UPI003A8787F3
MTLADVVAQLRTAVERLDQAAAGATRAQADLAQAHRHLDEAGAGSDHSQTRGAVDDAAIAAAKAGRLGNLLAKSAEAFSRYGNHIMPGSMPVGRANPDTSLPSGEEIVASTARPKSWHRRIAKKSVENAETAALVRPARRTQAYLPGFTFTLSDHQCQDGRSTSDLRVEVRLTHVIPRFDVRQPHLDISGVAPLCTVDGQ